MQIGGDTFDHFVRRPRPAYLAQRVQQWAEVPNELRAFVRSSCHIPPSTLPIGISLARVIQPGKQLAEIQAAG